MKITNYINPFSYACLRISDVKASLIRKEASFLLDYIYRPIMEKNFASYKVRLLVANAAETGADLGFKIVHLLFYLLAVPVLFVYFSLATPSADAREVFSIEGDEDIDNEEDLSTSGQQLPLYLPEDDEEYRHAMNGIAN